jgi:hypothetical protein
MSQDGAHDGIGAQRALDTILGGKAPPESGEGGTREQVRSRIMAAPSPGGPKPTDYDQGTDAIAKAFLIVSEENANLPLEIEALWQATKLKWPDFNQWLGGASGFMVGFACNVVRFLKQEPPAPNPALLTVSVQEG